MISELLFFKSFFESLASLKDTVYMDIFLIFFGALLGFLGSYINFVLTEKKKKKDALEKFICDLNILAEEIIHNSFALKLESYIAGNHRRQIEIKLAKKMDCGLNYYEYQKSYSRIEIRLKESELLKARLSGKIKEHDLLLEYSYTINEQFENLKKYKLDPNPFEAVSEIDTLENALKIDFFETEKSKFEKEFRPLLNNLVVNMQNNALEKLNSSWTRWILKNIFNA